VSEQLPDSVRLEEDQLGTISFANDVVAIIAGLAATEIAGVAGMSGGFSDGIAQILGRKNLTRGVKVEVGTQEVAIDLYCILEYGVNIPQVTQSMQENVKKAVETMTGLRVVEVNVHVLGVRIEKEVPALPAKEKEPEPAPRVK